MKDEIREIFQNFLFCKRFRRALITFMLWELSFYCVFILDVDMHIEAFRFLSLSMVSGWIAGIMLLKCIKCSDRLIIKWGLYLCMCCLVCVVIFKMIFSDYHVVTVSLFFIYSIGCGFLVPSLFSILSKERSPNDQGKIYGLIDSFDTIAFLLASISGIGYAGSQFEPNYVFILSLLIFMLSLGFYASFLKTNPKNLTN